MDLLTDEAVRRLRQHVPCVAIDTELHPCRIRAFNQRFIAIAAQLGDSQAAAPSGPLRGLSFQRSAAASSGATRHRRGMLCS
jgi:hypothetical protein